MLNRLPAQKDSINKFYDELNETLKTYRENATTTEGRNFFQGLLDVSDKLRNEELQKLAKVAEDFAGEIRLEMQNLLNKAKPFEIAWVGRTYQKNVILKEDVFSDKDNLQKALVQKRQADSGDWLEWSGKRGQVILMGNCNFKHSGNAIGNRIRK